MNEFFLVHAIRLVAVCTIKGFLTTACQNGISCDLGTKKEMNKQTFNQSTLLRCPGFHVIKLTIF